MRLAKRVRNIQPSATLAIAAKAKAMKAQGIDVIDFGTGEPDFDTPEHVKAAAVQALKEGFTKYTAPSGIDALKDAIIEKFQRDNGLTVARNQVLVSCGAKHTLYNIAQALFDAGDEVLIPSPYWVSYPDQVVLNDATPVFIPTREEDGFQVTAEGVKAALTPRTKAVIFNTPSNPTGAMMSRGNLESIGEILLRHDVTIISDEIYEKLTYDGCAHVSIASLDPRLAERTVVVNGVSKSHSMTGWRIGYAAGPRPLIEAMAAIQSQSTSNPTSIAQRAAVEALRGPQDFTEMMVKCFDARRRLMVDGLNRITGIRCLLPQGAFYTFPNISGVLGRQRPSGAVRTAADLAAYLLEEARVATVSGEPFGSGDHLRLSYATSEENIRKGLDRIADALSKLR